MSDVSELRRANTVDPDHQKIVDYLRQCSKTNLSSLITSIKSSKFNKTAENYLTLARLLQALSELCPNLHLCFSGYLLLEPSYLRDPTKDNDGDKEWESICSLLEEESIRFWCMWLEIFVGEWKQLDSKCDLNVMLKDFPCWDTISIEEKDESDNVVESVIHVPSQLSLSVQCFVYDIIVSLNKIIPHTLPRSVHTQIVEKLVEKLSNRYEALSKDEFVNGNQKVAWQFFLDVKVLTLLFIARDNKAMTEKFLNLANHFKSIIDPFDFDVFYQHVNTNIKRNAARLQHGVGCLVPNMEHLNTILANQNMASPHDKDPNVLMMSSTVTTSWFPLLPIISTKEAVPVQEVPKKDEKKVRKAEMKSREASKVRVSLFLRKFSLRFLEF
jgi:conserved oligomeric Golgi complex subunit 1